MDITSVNMMYYDGFTTNRIHLKLVSSHSPPVLNDFKSKVTQFEYKPYKPCHAHVVNGNIAILEISHYRP